MPIVIYEGPSFKLSLKHKYYSGYIWGNGSTEHTKNGIGSMVTTKKISYRVHSRVYGSIQEPRNTQGYLGGTGK